MGKKSDQGRSAGKQHRKARKVKKSADRERLQAIEKAFGFKGVFTKHTLLETLPGFFPTMHDIGVFIARMVKKGTISETEEGQFLQTRQSGLPEISLPLEAEAASAMSFKPEDDDQREEEIVDSGTEKIIPKSERTNARIKLLEVFCDKNDSFRPSEIPQKEPWFAAYTWPAIGTFFSSLVRTGEMDKIEGRYRATGNGLKRWRALARVQAAERAKEKEKNRVKKVKWTDIAENQTMILAAIAQIAKRKDSFYRKGVDRITLSGQGGVYDILEAKVKQGLPSRRTISYAYPKLEAAGFIERDDSKALRRWRLTQDGWDHLSRAQLLNAAQKAKTEPELSPAEQAEKPVTKAAEPAEKKKAAKTWMAKAENQDKALLALAEIVYGNRRLISEGVSAYILRNRKDSFMELIGDPEELPTYLSIIKGLKYLVDLGFLKKIVAERSNYTKWKITSTGWQRIDWLKKQKAAEEKKPEEEAETGEIELQKPEAEQPAAPIESEVEVIQSEAVEPEIFEVETVEPKEALPESASTLQNLRKKQADAMAQLAAIEKEIKAAELQAVDDCAKQIKQLVRQSGLPESRFDQVILAAEALLGYGEPSTKE